MFRSTRFLLVLVLFACAMAFLIFGGDPPESGGRAVDSRGFLAACEGGPFAEANASDSADAARLCSCILSWHLREGARAGYALPLERYRTGRPGEENTPAGAADAHARQACLSGRMPAKKS